MLFWALQPGLIFARGKAFTSLWSAQTKSAANLNTFLKVVSTDENGVSVQVTQGDYSKGFDKGTNGYVMSYGQGNILIPYSICMTE